MVGFELHSFVAKVFQEQITSCIPWKKFNHELNFTTLLRLHCIWDKVQRIQFQTIFLSFKRRFWYNKVIPDQFEFIQIGAQTNLFWRTANDFKNIFYVIFENQFWNQDVFCSFFYVFMYGSLSWYTYSVESDKELCFLPCLHSLHVFVFIWGDNMQIFFACKKELYYSHCVLSPTAYLRSTSNRTCKGYDYWFLIMAKNRQSLSLLILQSISSKI